MSDAGKPEYVPDHLYERLFQPWTLPESEWPLCKEDWARVDAITALPWGYSVFDVGGGDGTLAALLTSRCPGSHVWCYDPDESQIQKARERWIDWPITFTHQPIPDCFEGKFSGALCCEVLEHMTPEEGHKVLCDIKRVLKAGAMLCVTVPNQAGPRAAYPGHVREFTVAELARTVADAGFTITDGDAIGGKIIPVWFMAVARA